MKYKFFFFSITAVVVALVVSQNVTPTYAKESLKKIKKIVKETNTIVEDTNSNLQDHDSAVDEKLDQILTAIENGGGALVPKTGQTTSYRTGDDGEQQTGAQWPNPRFTDNGDGTVTDNMTHIIWDQNAYRFGTTQIWDDAIDDCNGLAAADYADLDDGSSAGDWRLPNVRELQSIIHYGVFDPAVPDTNGTGQWSAGDPFNDLQSSIYWSSTTAADDDTSALVVLVSIGNVITSGKGATDYVWCVRGGQ